MHLLLDINLHDNRLHFYKDWFSNFFLFILHHGAELNSTKNQLKANAYLITKKLSYILSKN